MLISKVELPVSDAVGGGPVLRRRPRPPDPPCVAASCGVRSGCQCWCSFPARWSRACTTAPSPSPKTALLRPRPGLQERVPLLERDGLDEFTLSTL